MPVCRFGPFVLDTDAYRLTCEDQVLVVAPRQLDLLAYLVERPSRLVTREELFKALWPDVIVTDNALTQLVSELRQTLSDSSAAPQYVQTVARRGYRFIGAVDTGEPQPAESRRVGAESVSHAPETSSLEALRAVMDGRLQLEALDGTVVNAAIGNFERAIALDPGFAGGYVGLANARFWQYERTRSGYRVDSKLLATAISEARRAVALAPEYAEAHATLGYLLSAAGRTDEALAAVRCAIALQPQQWSHRFRLGHAGWGEERLGALTECLRLYPSFPFAYFQMAMVHVARQALETAQRILEEGIAVQESMGQAGGRFPASGLHWMLGTILLSRRDPDAALAEFDLELAGDGRALYAPEYTVAALNNRGFALALEGRLDEAADSFTRSLASHQEQARPHLGLALVAGRCHDGTSAASSLARAGEAIRQLRLGGQNVEADLMLVGEHVVGRRYDEAVARVSRLLTESSPGPAGWSIPIDPLFAPLVERPAFRPVLQQLSARAT